MRQVEFEGPGIPADVVRCVDVPRPAISAPDQVLVRVLAFPISPADLLTLQGIYPRVDASTAAIGNEAIGEVVEIGDAVTDVAPGDRVILLALNNWREFRLVADYEVIKVSSAGDLSQQAGLKVNPATARLLLTSFVALGRGDWVMQTAASSAVGRAVIQIARAMGVRTVNVVRRAGVGDELKRLGADVVLVDGDDLPRRVAAATSASPIALGLDAVAGRATDRLASCLGDGATLVLYGAMSGEPMVVAPGTLVFKELSIRAFWLTPRLIRASAGEVRAMYADLDRMVVRGELKTSVDSEFTVDRIKDAVAQASRPGLNGKVLVRF